MDSINNVELLGVIGNIKESNIGDSKVYTFSLCTSEVHDSDTITQEWHNVKVLSKDVTGVLNIRSIAHVFGSLTYIKYINQEGEDVRIPIIFAQNVTIINE